VNGRGAALARGARGPYYPRQILRQMLDIGYYSLPVVGLTAIFTGMVLALQSYTGAATITSAADIPAATMSSISTCGAQNVLPSVPRAIVMPASLRRSRLRA